MERGAGGGEGKVYDGISSGEGKIPFPEYKGKIVEIDKAKAIEKLNDIIDHEEAYAFLADGTVYHKVGIKNKVSFNAHELQLFKNADLFHNHPGNDQPSLSKEDINFMLRGCQEIIFSFPLMLGKTLFLKEPLIDSGQTKSSPYSIIRLKIR